MEAVLQTDQGPNKAQGNIPTLDVAKSLYQTWKERIFDLEKKKEKGLLLLPENEALLCEPYSFAMQLRGIPIQMPLSIHPWDRKGRVIQIRTSEKSFRRFWEQQNNRDVEAMKQTFLIYKRYSTKYHFEAPDTSKETKSGTAIGLMGTTEILYCPNVKIPKSGRHVEGLSHPTLMNPEEQDEETTKISSLLTNKIIPLGKSGFFLFCSTQQANPHDIRPGENERIIIGPSAKGTRTRLAHLLRRLCQGKPEDLKKVQNFIDEQIEKIHQDILKTIADKLRTENPILLPEKKLIASQKEAMEDHIRGNFSAPLWHRNCRINLVPNLCNPTGTDRAIELKFGDRNSHEKDTEQSLLEGWKESLT